MDWPLFLRALGAAALLAAAPSQLLAAATANSTGETVVLRPLTLVKTADLDFGSLISSPAGGTATVDALTGAVTTAGGVTPAPGATSAAQFAGARSLRGPVIIRIPPSRSW